MGNKLISTKYPFLPLVVQVRVANRKNMNLDIQGLIDTGFSGDIAIPATEELKQYELTRTQHGQWPTGRK
jgi:hypothetical protein